MAEVVSFRLDKEHRRKLSKLADAWNCSQSDVIRRLLEDAKVEDVIRGGTKNEGDSDVKSATDRAKLIEELQRLHAAALRREEAKGGQL